MPPPGNTAVSDLERLPPAPQCAPVLTITLRVHPHSSTHRACLFLGDVWVAVCLEPEKQSAFHIAALILPHRTLGGKVNFLFYSLDAEAQKVKQISQEPTVGEP